MGGVRRLQQVSPAPGCFDTRCFGLIWSWRLPPRCHYQMSVLHLRTAPNCSICCCIHFTLHETLHRWHHGACVGYTEEDEANDNEFVCAACTTRRRAGQPIWIPELAFGMLNSGHTSLLLVEASQPGQPVACCQT